MDAGPAYLSGPDAFFPIRIEKSPSMKGRYILIKLRQHRTIRQEGSDRIFAPIQSSENGGILYVFPILGTAEVGQKDG